MLPKDPFNVIICGVGGQGNVKTSRILGKMLIDTYQVTIGETFGASQRGGSVMSHVRISADSLWSPQIPRGRADLFLALEPVEGWRTILHYGSESSHAVINTHPMYPISVIRGELTYPSLDEIKNNISARIEEAFFLDATALSMKEFNSSLYQNSILLGIVAALEYLPLKITTFNKAVSQVLASHTLTDNQKAFELGISQVHL
jgi:indolepyruvate ferredoxin oxidoreductase beta subunit